MVATKIMMNYGQSWFADEQVKGEVFNPLPRIAASKKGETVIHHGDIPRLGNCDFWGPEVGAERVVIDCGEKPTSFQHAHGRGRKYALGKHHYTVMLDPSETLMAVHAVDCLARLECKPPLIHIAKFSPCVITPMNR